MKPKMDLVAGARPNFVKLAPVVRALAKSGSVDFRIVHTGQHYDFSMDGVFFKELGIPDPDIHLEVGSGTHGVQTARILERYEAEIMKDRPAAMVVVGDVNSTLACAVAAAKLRIPVVHIEAGLRSFDRSMPEEINRLVTDAVSDLLFVSEKSGLENLQREGVADEKIRFVGNVMIDSLIYHLDIARRKKTLQKYDLQRKNYGFMTLHRPSNVDDEKTLKALMELFIELAEDLPLVFAMHPRTLGMIKKSGMEPLIRDSGNHLKCLEPQPYLDTISLVEGAAVVLTDSGGLQEETSFLRVPCLTMRENTERPITIEMGTSRLVGNNPDRIRKAFEDALRGEWPKGSPIPLWDGKAAERIARELSKWLKSRQDE